MRPSSLRRSKKKRKTRKNRKQKGGGITLYHGSPKGDIEELCPASPRSEKPWQKTESVYLTDSKVIAQLYAIARDIERKNKGWAVRGETLFLREDLYTGESPKYKLNEEGYLYIFMNVDAEKNPDPAEEHEYKVNHKIKPTLVETVKKEDIEAHIVYKPREFFQTL